MSERTYKAMRVKCPECGVEPTEACVKPLTFPMVVLRGVHRERDKAYNRWERDPRPGYAKHV